MMDKDTYKMILGITKGYPPRIEEPVNNAEAELTLIHERLSDLEMRISESLPTTIKKQVRFLHNKVNELHDKKPKEHEKYV